MKNRFTILIGLLVSQSAFAVQTINCPESMIVNIFDFSITAVVDENDSDYLTVSHAIDEAKRISELEGRYILTKRQSGRCAYRSEEGKAEIYSKNGKDILMAEFPLIENVDLRIYAFIENMAAGVSGLEVSSRPAVMIRYNASLCRTCWEGGSKIRKIGNAHVFEMIAE